MNKIRLILVFLSLVVCQTAGGQISTGDYNLAKLLTPPLDPDDAYRMKIWVPVEKIKVTRVAIIIYSDRNESVRKFFEGNLPQGYHNFFWDKKDDSGNFVPPGKYYCRIEMGNKKQPDQSLLEVNYKRGEKEVIVEPIIGTDTLGFTYEIMSDSARVSLLSLRADGSSTETVFGDSILFRGRHIYKFVPEKRLRFKEFSFRLTVDDYTHLVILRREK